MSMKLQAEVARLRDEVAALKATDLVSRLGGLETAVKALELEIKKQSRSKKVDG